jgi:poly [ADP-ribose] polymerase 2/3/4
MCVDISANSNKFWHIQENDDCTVTTRWGRVGVSEDTKTWSFSSQSQATREYDKKTKSKLRVTSNRDSYTKVDILTSQRTSQLNVPSGDLETIASRDIDVDCETTRDLIRWLSKVNIHNILQSTTMTYNDAEGVFKTPLGVVGKPMVDRARVLLNEISPYVQVSAYDDASLKRLANEYLRIIPQDLGGTQSKLRLDKIFSHENLRKQADILDALDASIASILTTPKKDATLPNKDEDRVFNVKLHTVEDDEVIRDIKSKFNHTRQRQHLSYSFGFKQAYTVDIASMRALWEKDGALLSNRMRLWHGTKPANVLSILKQGLIIPPSTASFVNGRMYGNGIYFSDQSTKSLNYSCSYQGNRVFMFLADVGMGRYYVPPGSINRIPDEYDSCYAEAGKSGVMNHEMICYRVSQCNLVYLVEFSR